MKDVVVMTHKINSLLEKNLILNIYFSFEKFKFYTLYSCITPNSVVVYAVLFVCEKRSEATMHTNRHCVHRLQHFVRLIFHQLVANYV